MALLLIKEKLIQLIEEYEEGIEDNFMRGYVKGKIEAYGEMICYGREKNDEPFNDYIVRLKRQLKENGELETMDLFSCHFGKYVQDKSEMETGICERCKNESES